MGHYDTALVCLNGHLVNSMHESSPEFSTKHCGECGASTISECPECGAKIRGYYHSDVVVIGQKVEVQSYCYNCGAPYPWTEKRIRAARELVEELEGLSDEDRELLKASLEDIVRDTPRTEVAAFRVKKVLAKARGPALMVMMKMLEQIAVEVAREVLFGGGTIP